MKRLITALLIAATGWVAMAGPAMARPDHDNRRHGPHEGPGHMMRMFKGLDLSDAQRSPTVERRRRVPRPRGGNFSQPNG